MPETLPTTSPALTTALTTAWETLIAWYTKWFHFSAEMADALEICVCAALAHSLPGRTPVWLLISGPSSSGKTSIAIETLRAFPGSHTLGDLTPRTLLSNLGATIEQKKKNSLLFRLGSAPRLLAKDFTTIFSQPIPIRAQVFAQLREIYDGTFRSDSGAGASLEWSGKCTFIAAATPAIERHWAAMRELGERFLLLRWPTGDIQATLDAARRQQEILGEAELRRQQDTLAAAFVATLQGSQAIFSSLPPIPAPMTSQLDAMATVIAQARNTVVRDWRHGGQPMDAEEHEIPARIIKTLQTITQMAAILHGRREVGQAELNLGWRITLDNIPRRRRKIIEGLGQNGAEVTLLELAAALGWPKKTVAYYLDEMETLGIVQGSRRKEGRVWRRSAALSDSFLALWDHAERD